MAKQTASCSNIATQHQAHQTIGATHHDAVAQEGVYLEQLRRQHCSQLFIIFDVTGAERRAEWCWQG